MSLRELFGGRDLVIATMHRKEEVIAPVLEKELGVTCFVPSSFNTDQFGTFSGEKERKDDPLTTARKKCLMAMEQSGAELGVASEGSFGPHPFLYFIPANDELLIFIDRKNGFEIIVRELSTDTNFAGSTVLTKQELNDFAERVQFPSHGIILRPSPDNYTVITKGITDVATLHRVFNELMAQFGNVYAETDMRAHFNPLRMKVISKAVIKLTEKIASFCPQCNAPGFGVSDIREGLPCQLCGSPTRSTLSHVYSCHRCEYRTEKLYPNEKKEEDPMYCDYCNP
ncbi:MAG TPA: DUF6671 family protein [Chitinophagaceae bacterium]|nr:DUF6671 family protein [Chitinophagaceae bacterium]